MYTWNDGTYLAHHGIKGQKWGLRRYQNFDGSYTKAGLERYGRSKENYERARETRKTAQEMAKATKKYGYYTDQKTGQRLAVMPEVVKEAKKQERDAKRRMNKDYRHLALDKKADKGKARYARGERITNNASRLSLISELSLGVAVGAEYARRNGMISTRDARYAQYASIGLGTVASLGTLLSAIPNSELRAYYAHTSHY